MKLFKHQEETARWLSTRSNGGAVLSEQGTGKTFSVIEYLNRRVSAPEKILVVCPASITGVWQGEIKKFSPMYKDRVWVVSGTRKKRLAMLHSKEPGIYIINYEGARSLRKDYNLAKMKIWDVVIADEMTRIKNHKAQQSKALHDFVKYSPRTMRIGITGTPITQSPLDAFSQFYFIDPGIFGTSWWEFRNRYSIVRKRVIQGRTFHEDVDYRNLDVLSQKIYKNSIRHTKDDCLDLPEKMYQRIEVKWRDDERDVYDQLKEDFIASVRDSVLTASNALSKMSKLRQICGGWFYGEDGDAVLINEKKRNSKMDTLIQLVEDASAPVIVWACFRQDIDAIEKELTKAKISYVTISGKIDKQERFNSADRFQRGGIKVAICQTDTAQYGLTLTAASTAIFYSQSWSVENRLQAEDRCHRIGQDDKCLYIDLVMEDSVEESISGILKSKKKVADSVVDNQSIKSFLEGNSF